MPNYEGIGTAVPRRLALQASASSCHLWDLDSRGFGDIWTMTKAEYESAPESTWISYRLFRHPLILLGLGPVFTFLMRFRLPSRMAKRKARVNIVVANLLIAAIIVSA